MNKVILSVFGTTTLGLSTVCGSMINQSELKSSNYFYADNDDKNFSVGGFGRYLEPSFTWHTESYDLTYHTNITSWLEFKSKYHYFAYNSATWQSRNWYNSSIDYELSKSFNKINSTINLENTMDCTGESPVPTDGVEDSQRRGANIDVDPFSANFDHYVEASWINPENVNSASELVFKSFATKTDDGHLHFTVELMVRNEVFSSPWGDYCFMWHFQVDNQASFWY